MKTLVLPEPARGFWQLSRPVLDAVMPRSEGWRRHLGGGTILAARMGHRESTDIDIIVSGGGSLKRISSEIARRIDGKVDINDDDQITITREATAHRKKDKLDISKVPISPETGQKPCLIDGQKESVLSTAQIIRGKLARGLKPGPVRDAYDIIRASRDDRKTQEALVAACGDMPKNDIKAIEKLLKKGDKRLEERAHESLHLTEPSVVGFDRIGTTAQKVIQGHRLRQVTIRLEDGLVLTERRTINGKRFETLCSPRQALRTWKETGVQKELENAGIGLDRLKMVVDTQLARHRTGFIIKTRSRKIQDQLRDLDQPKPAPARPPTGRPEQNNSPDKGWNR